MAITSFVFFIKKDATFTVRLVFMFGVQIPILSKCKTTKKDTISPSGKIRVFKDSFISTCVCGILGRPSVMSGNTH
jgi:hypothetical protein